MYIGDKSVSPRVYEDSGDRWEYAVALTPTNEFVQISNNFNQFRVYGQVESKS